MKVSPTLSVTVNLMLITSYILAAIYLVHYSQEKTHVFYKLAGRENSSRFQQKR
jgi:hypothetical protein